ncbi:MAG: nitroreductase family protein [Dehalococcoidales bacterium]|nr:MAG: nitroreductase family protein [Dehalococcoidales bacterium]
MPLIDLIKQRRSVRNFLDKPIEREKIMACLEAARLAPSASNSQPWSFLVVDDPALRDRVCKNAFRGPYFINSFCKKAPVILVVISERSKFLTRIAAVFRGTQFYLIDIGISVEHFVLQAEESGLGTCWIGWFNEKEVKKTLSIPESKKVDILVAVGYRDTSIPFNEYNREKPEDIIMFNRYNTR